MKKANVVRQERELLEGAVKEERSLAHREHEDKMPTKYLCSWLVASSKWDINNCDDWSTPRSGNSPGRGGRRHRFQSRLQHGIVL